MPGSAGLRERKWERTRVAIERAACELALERGWEHATVDEIAARADVAPRTVFSRYATKDAIILRREEPGPVRRSDWLEGPVDTVVDRLRRFVEDRIETTDHDRDLQRLRLRAMLQDSYLRRALRGRLDAIETDIADYLTTELGLTAHDAGPRVFAAAVSGLFLSMAELTLVHPDGFDPIWECRRGLAVLQAGLSSLVDASP